MPRTYLMSYEDSPHYRWVKMLKGQRYRVTCDELGKPRNKQESYVAANEWWTRKVAELTTPIVPGSQEAVSHMLEVFAGKPLQTELEKAAAVAGIMDLYKRHPMPDEVAMAFMGVDKFAALEAGVDALIASPRVETNFTMRHQCENFLSMQADMKPLSYRELRQYMLTLANDHEGMDVRKVDEDFVQRVFRGLKGSSLSQGVKKKRWGFFRRFVRHLYGRRLIELPRNLSEHGFKVVTKAIKTHSDKSVVGVLRELKPRLRLYGLLGLNAGMTSADMGQLTKDMVDLHTGRLVRRRVKTADNENVPTVSYKLWPETLSLLKEHLSDHPTLVLTSEDGTQLWTAEVKGDACPVKDLIYQQFRRARCGITVKEFRSIAATKLESHENYGRYVAHFLGHSPKSVADKHYKAPSPELFDTMMTWLRGALGISQDV